MKAYGKFEAVRELYQTPLGAIWTARAQGTEGQADACIKLVEPDSSVFEGGGKAAAEQMLVAAAIQQSIANKAEFWAPIYALGYDGKSAFYVTKLCERSLQRIISSKVKLTSAELLTITSGIVEGLSNLQQAFNRSHGNLKPSNVLIAGRGRLRPDDVLLTDPLAEDLKAPSITRSPDVKAIGEILYALVTGRPHTSARWPVQSSVEWNRLGSSGQQWLALCNDLLNSMAREGPPTLAQVKTRLTSIRHSRRSIPRSWIAAAVLLAAIGGGAIYHENVEQVFGQAKSWATGLVSKPRPRLATTRDSLSPVMRPETKSALPQPTPGLVIPKPILPVAPIVPVVPASSAQVNPIVHPPDQITRLPEPVRVPIVVPVPAPILVTKAEPNPPAFLPPEAAAVFSRSFSLKSLTDDEPRGQFVRDVERLETVFPLVKIQGDRPWQRGLQKLVDARRETELANAIEKLSNGSQPDGAKYAATGATAKLFNAEAMQAEDIFNNGTCWSPDANGEILKKASVDQANFFQNATEKTAASPAALDEWRSVSDAVAAQNIPVLLGVLHDQNSSLPARVAAWQGLDQPGIDANREPKWPANRADFVAGRKDGEALTAAAAGSTLNTRIAIGDFQTRRLKRFYATLTSEPLLVDAITHLSEIEGAQTEQRPGWMDFDRLLYLLKSQGTVPTSADLEPLKAFAGLSAADQLMAAVNKASATAADEQPLKHIGPGLLGWVSRPFSANGIDGCLYSNDNCPLIEFIRVDPVAGSDALPFYLSTTEVPVGLVLAMLNDPAQTAQGATDALKLLNHASEPPTPGARMWKFNEGAGIELDAAPYADYFRQTPSMDLPIQQITPQSAMFIARNIGCRLPTSQEWQAAFTHSSDPANPDDRMKGFATSAWKLRDADFLTLVEKASLINRRYPDEGIFPGSEPATVSTGAKAKDWSADSIRKMGGWSIPSLKFDLAGQRQMAKLDQNSSDFRADLLDPAQLGFRPIGTTHHVFHDLIGNVAEFVIDVPWSDVDTLPTGMRIQEKEISNWFASEDRLAKVGVIGGSFLSPPEMDPRVRQPLPPNIKNASFSDVGFRLAFTDPKAFASPLSVIKFAKYAYPQVQ